MAIYNTTLLVGDKFLPFAAYSGAGGIVKVPKHITVVKDLMALHECNSSIHNSFSLLLFLLYFCGLRFRSLKCKIRFRSLNEN